MVENHHTRRATLKRLGAGLTAGVLLSGGAAGSAAAADTSEVIVPPQGQDSDWTVRWSDRPKPLLTSVAEEKRYQLTGGANDTSVGWTRYTSDRRFSGDGLKFNQTTRPRVDEGVLWLEETVDNVDADVTQTTAIGAPFRIQLGEEMTPALLSADTVGSYAGVVEVGKRDDTYSNITSVDVTLSVGIIPVAVLDTGETFPGVASANALAETELLSQTITSSTDPVIRTEEIAASTANGTVTAQLPESGSYVVYWRLTTKTDTEYDEYEMAQISFSPAGPNIGDIDPVDRGIHLDEVVVELQELGD